MTVAELAAAIDGLVSLSKLINDRIEDMRKAGQISVAEQASLKQRMKTIRDKVGL